MKLNNLDVGENFDINFLCYLFLKILNSTDGATEKQLKDLVELSYRYTDRDTAVRMYEDFFTNLPNAQKRDNLLLLPPYITDDNTLQLFNFCLKLIPLKDLLLQEAKLIAVSNSSELAKYHQLSLEYDVKSSKSAWYIRVSGALLALLLFRKLEENSLDFLSEASNEFIQGLKDEYHKLKKLGLEANQILMLVFAESMSQSIRSSGGSSYEDRIIQILVAIGIDRDSIKKQHDENDSATEYDMFFELDGRTVGIGAKRTLRERYKQFLNANTDVVITITLGIDLNSEKVKTITNTGIKIFVADEIYNAKSYMQDSKNVYPASEFTLKTLKNFIKDLS